jgi:hypothetical protein
MYAPGEKYIALGLKIFAKSRFTEVVQHLSNTDVASVMEYVYKSTHEQDRGLRDIILRVVTTKVANLMQEDDFCRVAVDIPRFGFEFLARTVKMVQQQNLRTYKISDCSHCPPKESDPSLYCRHNRAAEGFCIS